jgi:hypothetical protein
LFLIDRNKKKNLSEKLLSQMGCKLVGMMYRRSSTKLLVCGSDFKQGRNGQCNQLFPFAPLLKTRSLKKMGFFLMSYNKTTDDAKCSSFRENVLSYSLGSCCAPGNKFQNFPVQLCHNYRNTHSHGR